MRSYPSFVAGLGHPCPETGIRRHLYAEQHVRTGDALIPQRETDCPFDDDAVALRHHGFHLGYIPNRHDWVARALDEGDALAIQVVDIKTRGWWVFRRVSAVFLRITVVRNG